MFIRNPPSLPGTSLECHGAAWSRFSALGGSTPAPPPLSFALAKKKKKVLSKTPAASSSVAMAQGHGVLPESPAPPLRAPHHTVSQPPAKKAPAGLCLSVLLHPACCSLLGQHPGWRHGVLGPHPAPWQAAEGEMPGTHRGGGPRCPPARPSGLGAQTAPFRGGKTLLSLPESPPKPPLGEHGARGWGLSGGPCGDPTAPTSSGCLSSAGFQSPRKAQAGARSVPRGMGARARHGCSPLPRGAGGFN